MIIIAALLALWWKGILLPTYTVWNTYETLYEDYDVLLKDRCVVVKDKQGNELWKTEGNIYVQDMLIRDLDRDGREELALLVWKHGSFGKHIPMWVKNNDIRLEQHIFIYKLDSSWEDFIRPVWMSSSMGKDIRRISGFGNDKILIDYNDASDSVWYWDNFGLKYAGEGKEIAVSFACVGDNLVHPWLLNAVDDDYNSLYEGVRDTISSADVAIVNQETVLVDDMVRLSDYPRFALPSELADALANTGFDVISLANNHILDWGEEGLISTENACLNAFSNCNTETSVDNRTCVGINLSDNEEDYTKAVKFINCKGLRIALLSFTYGTNGRKQPERNKYSVETFDNPDRIAAELDYANSRADAVVVYAHWGNENETEVSDEQIRIRDFLFEHNVDVVIGTHPHVLQDYEYVDDKGRRMLVYYSLGNFVNGQENDNQLVGGLARFNIVKTSDGTVYVADERLDKLYMVHGDGEYGIKEFK